jgi:hypothetical protein
MAFFLLVILAGEKPQRTGNRVIRVSQTVHRKAFAYVFRMN